MALSLADLISMGARGGLYGPEMAARFAAPQAQAIGNPFMLQPMQTNPVAAQVPVAPAPMPALPPQAMAAPPAFTGMMPQGRALPPVLAQLMARAKIGNPAGFENLLRGPGMNAAPTGLPTQAGPPMMRQTREPRGFGIANAFM